MFRAATKSFLSSICVIRVLDIAVNPRNKTGLKTETLQSAKKLVIGEGHGDGQGFKHGSKSRFKIKKELKDRVALTKAEGNLGPGQQRGRGSGPIITTPTKLGRSDLGVQRTPALGPKGPIEDFGIGIG